MLIMTRIWPSSSPLTSWYSSWMIVSWVLWQLHPHLQGWSVVHWGWQVGRELGCGKGGWVVHPELVLRRRVVGDQWLVQQVHWLRSHLNKVLGAVDCEQRTYSNLLLEGTREDVFILTFSLFTHRGNCLVVF